MGRPPTIELIPDPPLVYAQLSSAVLPKGCPEGSWRPRCALEVFSRLNGGVILANTRNKGRNAAGFAKTQFEHITCSGGQMTPTHRCFGHKCPGKGHKTPLPGHSHTHHNSFGKLFLRPTVALWAPTVQHHNMLGPSQPQRSIATHAFCAGCGGRCGEVGVGVIVCSAQTRGETSPEATRECETCT